MQLRKIFNNENFPIHGSKNFPALYCRCLQPLTWLLFNCRHRPWCVQLLISKFQYLDEINPLTTDDAFWGRQILAACYQLAQSVLKIGSALPERRGGWVHCSGWQCMAAVAAACRKAQVNATWSIGCFLAQTGVKNAPFTLLYDLHF